MSEPVKSEKTVVLTEDDFETLVTAYYELAEVVWNAPDLKPCWDQVAELDELVEPIVGNVRPHLADAACPTVPTVTVALESAWKALNCLPTDDDDLSGTETDLADSLSDLAHILNNLFDGGKK